MLSICMCVTEFDIVLGKCSLLNSSDVYRYNCARVSEYGIAEFEPRVDLSMGRKIIEIP